MLSYYFTNSKKKRIKQENIENTDLKAYYSLVINNHTSKYINKNDFNIIRSTISSNDKNESAFIFLLDDLSIPDNRLHSGPLSNMKKESIAFIKKNKKEDFCI